LSGLYSKQSPFLVALAKNLAKRFHILMYSF
jgi:hypothetical protein